MTELEADDIDRLEDNCTIAWVVLAAARCEDIMLLAFRQAYINRIGIRKKVKEQLCFVPKMLKGIEEKKVFPDVVTDKFKAWIQNDTMRVGRFLEYLTPGEAAETTINTLQLELNKEETVADNSSLLEFVKILHAEPVTGRKWLLEEACISVFNSLRLCFDNLQLIGIPTEKTDEIKNLFYRFISIRNHVTHNLRLGRTVLKNASVTAEFKEGYSALLKCGVMKEAYPDGDEDGLIQDYCLKQEEDVNVLNLVKQIKEQSSVYRQMEERNNEQRRELEDLNQQLRQATSSEQAAIRMDELNKELIEENSSLRTELEDLKQQLTLATSSKQAATIRMDELNKELIVENSSLRTELEDLKQQLRQATSSEQAATISSTLVRSDSNTSTMSVEDEDAEEKNWKLMKQYVRLGAPQPVSDDDRKCIKDPTQVMDNG